MKNYYAEKLSAGKLLDVYDTDIPRVAQYLTAEIDHIKSYLKDGFKAIELGAGYGRIMKELAPHLEYIDGIDIAGDSVAFGQHYLSYAPNARLYQADAFSYETEEKYDLVICAQNGLSAIKGDPLLLVQRAVSLLNAGGTALFSTYSAHFWAYRLAWFQEQSDKGLLGELDFEKSVNGKIVCKDGFSSTAFTEGDLRDLGENTGRHFYIEEIDCSSLFLIVVNQFAQR